MMTSKNMSEIEARPVSKTCMKMLTIPRNMSSFRALKEVWYNKNFFDEISLNFPELLIKGKYVKIRFGNKGSPC